MEPGHAVGGIGGSGVGGGGVCARHPSRVIEGAVHGRLPPLALRHPVIHQLLLQILALLLLVEPPAAALAAAL
jgi:hypothetical protein